MKRMTLVTLVMSLIASTAATADSIKDKMESVVRQAEQRRDHDRNDGRDNRDHRRDSRDDRRDDRRDWRDDRRDDRRDWRDDRRDDRRDWRDDRRDDRRDWRHDRRDDRRDWRHDHRYDGRRVHAGPYRFPHGYRAHYWRQGERLPRAYYAAPYVIRDYRGCHLRPPPRGHHWVRVNQDVILTAIATGVVIEVLRNHFY